MPITISGSGTIAGISAGGLPDGCIITSDIAANAVTTAKIDTTTQGGFAKAWVNFDGTVTSTFAGGASTVSRTAGSTTATITTTTAHGLTSGNFVYALTGVVAGLYQVTVLSSTTFSITTAATTVLSAVAITFQFSNIRNAYNINSIVKNAAGDYVANFTTAMADASYAISGFARQVTGAAAFASTTITMVAGGTTEMAAASCRFRVGQGGNTVGTDSTLVCLQVFR
jgi:hypothetical protein